MKRTKKILIFFALITLIVMSFSVTAFAVTEDEVQQQVSASSKETVSGNVFIWFLCAIAFLKISQKIDSFMSSLGINVGHTGGNMLAEAAIAMRGVSMGKQALGGGSGFGKGGGGSGGSGGGERTSVLSGGLAGSISRQFNKSAVSSATNQGGNVVTRNAFQSSMAKGGNFANSVIGSVAKGNISNMGSITGDTASKAMQSYMGYAGKGAISSDSGGGVGDIGSQSGASSSIPTFSNVEIGGGRIMGTETSESHPQGIQFGMYNTDQYMAPEKGDYETVKAADGSKWYKQYATDTVEKIPYKTDEGSIAYNENLVQKLPPVPRRKDRV